MECTISNPAAPASQSGLRRPTGGGGQKNDFRDAEAVQRPTMKFVATKTADQLDLQALHRVRDTPRAGMRRGFGLSKKGIGNRDR
jgi:hypothetical protein